MHYISSAHKTALKTVLLKGQSRNYVLTQEHLYPYNTQEFYCFNTTIKAERQFGRDRRRRKISISITIETTLRFIQC